VGVIHPLATEEVELFFCLSVDGAGGSGFLRRRRGWGGVGEGGLGVIWLGLLVVVVVGAGRKEHYLKPRSCSFGCCINSFHRFEWNRRIKRWFPAAFG